MVAVGWHNRRRLLVLTNAGHPPPLWYSRTTNEWRWFETQRTTGQTRPAGLPLGLLPDISYDRRVVKAPVGDLLVLYSDGVSEATNPAGAELGRDGLMEIARQLTLSSAEDVGTELTSALNHFRGGAASADDETIIVLQRVV